MDLIYISTPPQISEALLASRLERFVPRIPWVQKPRVFLMVPLLATQIRDGVAGNGVESVERWEKLEADISTFVEKGFVNRSLLKQLDPKKYEHWAMRSVRPRPSLRVFGRFGCPDLFIGTHAVSRPSLREKWSLEWEIEKLVCEDHWQKAVGDLLPFKGSAYSDYITENASEDIRIDP